MNVLQDWTQELPLQQQAVLIMALRGPDGFEKFHPSKPVVRAMRGCVMVAAYYGRALRLGEAADTYMEMDKVSSVPWWDEVIKEWAKIEDGLPLHFYQHMMQAANICRFQHPELRIRGAWSDFYLHCCDYLHVEPESEETFLKRLSDWNRKAWGDETHSADVIAQAKADDLRQ